MLNQYSDLLEIANHEAATTGIDVNTSLKEILHYDILYALGESNMAQKLVLQGGAALRLCYQGNRYSEDLDFVSGAYDLAAQMNVFKRVLSDVVGDRYGLKVRFKNPSLVQTSDSSVHVNRWIAVVELNGVDKCQQQTQKIKIEVANVPSYDNHPLFIERQYEGLAPGYNHILLRTCSLQEILADKIVAICNRPGLKARDVWDTAWLVTKGIEVDFQMLLDKFKDYEVHQSPASLMEEKLHQLRLKSTHEAFTKEMDRYLNAKMRKSLNRSTIVTASTIGQVQSLLGTLKQALQLNMDYKPAPANELPAYSL